jgi:hypothetical protein
MPERVTQYKTRLTQAIVIASFVLPVVLPAQSQDSATSLLRYVTPLTLVNGMPADRIRLDQTKGEADLDGYLIRSASSMNPRPQPATGWSASVIAPELYAVNNTAIPFSINDGPVWAGVGTSSRLLLGGQVAVGPFRLILAPEIVRADNDYFLLRDVRPNRKSKGTQGSHVVARCSIEPVGLGEPADDQAGFDRCDPILPGMRCSDKSVRKSGRIVT